MTKLVFAASLFSLTMMILGCSLLIEKQLSRIAAALEARP